MQQRFKEEKKQLNENIHFSYGSLALKSNFKDYLSILVSN